jgi:hypothetical protein
MHKKTRKRLSAFVFSVMLSGVFVLMGARMLYADYKRTTTMTTSQAPAVTVSPQPVVVEQQPMVTTTTQQPVVTTTQQPTVVTTQQPAVVTTQQTIVPAAVAQERVNNYITYDIDVKKVFQSNENVDGQIIVNNAGPATLADSFNIRLYHNGKLIRELLTRMTAIPPGENRYSFKDFGIPQINDNPNAEGNWTMSIYDVDPAYSKDVDFRIIQSTNSNNLQR